MARVLSQMYLLLTSISCLLMGMNCILFFFCVYVFWSQKSKSCRLLLFSSTVQFCLSLTQVVLFIKNINSGFTVHANNSDAYFLQLNPYDLPSYIIFLINNTIEASLLIWRVFIIYNKNIMACILSVILLTLEVAFSGATAKGAATVHVNPIHEHAFSLVTWSLIAAVNASATLLILLRLWVARKKAFAMFSQSKYKSTIIVVVECGLLVTACTIAMLILHAVKHPVGIAGVGITTQIATMVPLLILARYGLLSSRNNARGLLTSQIPLRISVVRTQDTRVDAAVEFSRKKRLPPDPFPVCRDSDHMKPFSDACGEAAQAG